MWVDETRPLLQGARLTMFELERLGIDATLIADSAAASLMAAGEVDLVIVGADRIAANGDVANKVGTYSLAVLARHHGIPFYVAAPTSTIDLATADGAAIRIEERDPDEVRTFGGQPVAPAGLGRAEPGLRRDAGPPRDRDRHRGRHRPPPLRPLAPVARAPGRGERCRTTGVVQAVSHLRP